MKKCSFILVLSVLLFSCAKENSDTFLGSNSLLVDTTWYNSIAANAEVNQLRNLLITPPIIDSFEVNNNPAFVTLADSTNIYFPASSCVLPSGAAFTGKAKIEFIALKKKGDFVSNNKPTVTTVNQLLETGGSFSLRLLKDGQPLLLANGKSITVQLKESQPQTNHQIYYGANNGWQVANDSSSVSLWTTLVQGNTTILGYQFLFKKYNWISSNSMIDTALPKVNIVTYLPVNYTNANTTVFAVLKQHKTVIRGIPEVSNRTFILPRIPLNKQVVLISVTKIGTAFYVGINEITTSANQQPVQIIPLRKTESEMRTIINAL